MQRIYQRTARGAPAAENRLILYTDAAWPASVYGTPQQNRDLLGPLRWQAQVYTWAEPEAVLCKMRWIMGQNQVAARMIWLLQRLRELGRSALSRRHDVLCGLVVATAKGSWEVCIL